MRWLIERLRAERREGIIARPFSAREEPLGDQSARGAKLRRRRSKIEFGRRARLAQHEALGEGASCRAQERELLRRFDSLGGGGDAERPAEAGNRADDRRAIASSQHVAHKR